MPNRIIKESICTSDTLDQLSADEERLFYRLITKVDDYGRFDGRAAVVRSLCLPLKVDVMTVWEVEQQLQSLAKAGLIHLYAVDGRRYLCITKWQEHQRPPRAKESKYPDPPLDDDICGQMAADVSGPPSDAPGIRDSGFGIREAGDEIATETSPPPPDPDPAVQIERALRPYLDTGMTAPKDSREVERWVRAGATPDMFPAVLEAGLTKFRERNPGKKPMSASWYSGYIASEVSARQTSREPPASSPPARPHRPQIREPSPRLPGSPVYED